MLPAPLWLALVRAMLVVDDGTRITQLPCMGRQGGGGLAAKKEANPASLRSASPFPWKGLAWTFPPSYGRRCPEGAEVGWGKRYPRNKAFPA